MRCGGETHYGGQQRHHRPDGTRRYSESATVDSGNPINLKKFTADSRRERRVPPRPPAQFGGLIHALSPTCSRRLVETYPGLSLRFEPNTCRSYPQPFAVLFCFTHFRKICLRHQREETLGLFPCVPGKAVIVKFYDIVETSGRFRCAEGNRNLTFPKLRTQVGYAASAVGASGLRAPSILEPFCRPKTHWSAKNRRTAIVLQAQIWRRQSQQRRNGISRLRRQLRHCPKVTSLA